MTTFPALVENALIGDNVDDSELDTNVDEITHWQRICAAGIAAVSVGCMALLELNDAAIVLNSKSIGMSSSDKEAMRRSMIKYLFQSDQRCHGLIRMSASTFKLLCEKLQATGRLRCYHHTSAEEQVATFMFIISQKWTNRAISFFMSCSGETCSRYFHNVLHSLISLWDELIKQPTGNDLSNVILNNTRFYPFFKDCLGALDGTHVRVKVPKLDAARYQGRKDFPTQNVLACCTFDLRLTYILAGWEGSASDSRVLKSALTREDPLRIPNGKYYLGDAGFGLSNKILVPYGRTRYHLKEYTLRGPLNYQELFNLRHASLCNCIERCFGILKKRFPIISTGVECQYSCATMTDIILACCVLHNFLIGTESEEIESEDRQGDTDTLVEEHNAESVGTSHDEQMDYTKGKQLRDAIAMETWKHYEVDSIMELNSPVL